MERQLSTAKCPKNATERTTSTSENHIRVINSKRRITRQLATSSKTCRLYKHWSHGMNYISQ